MKLKDICKFVNEKVDTSSFHLEDYVSTENLLPNKGGVTVASKIPQGKATLFKKGDILISNIRPYFKKIYLAKKQGCCSNDVLCIRPNSNIPSSYLYYLLSQDSFFDYVMTGAKGTKMPRGDKGHIMNWAVYQSTLSQQQNIAEILAPLDDKIAVNSRICANLEAQAEALFKSWFVDFTPFKDQPFVDSELGPIPQGWKVGKLGDICTFKRGKNLLSKNAIDEGVPVVAGGLSPSCYHNQANTSAPVVTVSGSGANAGFMRMYHVDVWASDCSFIDVSCDYLYFVYCFLSVNRRLLKHAQTGAVQPHVKPADIHDFDVVIPEEDIVKAFQSIIKELLTKVGVNEKENQRLAALRDTLLPKLMSGEIKL